MEYYFRIKCSEMEQADPEHIPVAKKAKDLVFGPCEAWTAQSIGFDKLWVKTDFLGDARSFRFFSL